MACLCPPPVEFADAKDLGECHPVIRDRGWTMIQHRPRGTTLYCNSGRRTDWMQYLLRVERCSFPCSRSSCGYPTTAAVCKSNHRNLDYDISAIDFAGSALSWANDHAYLFGLSMDVVPREPWHAENAGEPRVPIIPYPSGGIVVPPPPRPEDVMNAAQERAMRDGLERLGDIGERTIASLTRIEQRLTGVATKAQALRDKSDGRVWIVTEEGRWHIPDSAALNILIYTGQVAVLPDGKPAVVDPSALAAIPVLGG